jgi:hypothetical protein
MTLAGQDVSENAPRMYDAGLPAEERRAAVLVCDNLRLLKTHVDALGAALSLFDYCDKQRRICRETLAAAPRDEIARATRRTMFSWQLVAARDGAMTIYHFATAMDGIDQTVATCPTLLALMNRPMRKAANQYFRQYFPSYIDIRDAVVHTAEKTKTPEKPAEHAHKAAYESSAMRILEGSTLVITNTLEGRRFTNTWEGRVLAFELSQETVNQLDNVKAQMWTAFREAERQTRDAFFAEARSAVQYPAAEFPPLKSQT